MAVAAVWDNGVLIVVGDEDANAISISRDVVGAIVVKSDLEPVPILNAPGGGATVANTTSIFVYGLEGPDHISVNDQNGPLPFTYLNGGDGNDDVDILIGGSGAEWLDGGTGEDEIDGGGGADYIIGDTGGDDFFDWTVGDGSDLIDDTSGSVIVHGTGGANTLSIVGAGAGAYGYVFADETDELVLKKSFGPIKVDSGGGNDVIILSGNFVFNGVLEIDAGAGDDLVVVSTSSDVRIRGGDGADYLVGGSGDDILAGLAGIDIVTGGAGEDEFRMSGGDIGEYDYIVDFDSAQGDFITASLLEPPLVVQVGAHVLVAYDETFATGVIVLNATAADVAANIF